MYQGTYVVRRGPLYYKTLEFEKQKKRDELEKARNAQIAEAIRVARIKAARECNIDKSKIIPRSNYDYAIKSHFMMAVAAMCRLRKLCPSIEKRLYWTPAISRCS